VHIYAFGSLCRGEVDFNSDVDLLAVVEGNDNRFNPANFSIYSYSRLRQLWSEGNPFAWHLYMEAKLLFSEASSDYLRELGAPAIYTQASVDCDKFARLYAEARHSIDTGTASITFEFSTIFLAIRNFATCFSLRMQSRPVFSRRSALLLGTFSLPIGVIPFEVLERARLLSTRGLGNEPSKSEALATISDFAVVDSWIARLREALD
jgi:hypothetical protein